MSHEVSVQPVCGGAAFFAFTSSLVTLAALL